MFWKLIINLIMDKLHQVGKIIGGILDMVFDDKEEN